MSKTIKEVLDISRPRKWRKVCCLPESSLFGSLNATNINDGIINMAVEEYETIRLIDLEGYTQEDCASQMNVARTTVQWIYNDARKKIAEALVNNRILHIEGGNYRLCDGLEESCGCSSCSRHKLDSNSIDDGNGGE